MKRLIVGIDLSWEACFGAAFILGWLIVGGAYGLRQQPPETDASIRAAVTWAWIVLPSVVLSVLFGIKLAQWGLRQEQR